MQLEIVLSKSDRFLKPCTSYIPIRTAVVFEIPKSVFLVALTSLTTPRTSAVSRLAQLKRRGRELQLTRAHIAKLAHGSETDLKTCRMVGLGSVVDIKVGVSLSLSLPCFLAIAVSGMLRLKMIQYRRIVVRRGADFPPSTQASLGRYLPRITELVQAPFPHRPNFGRASRRAGKRRSVLEVNAWSMI